MENSNKQLNSISCNDTSKDHTIVTNEYEDSNFEDEDQENSTHKTTIDTTHTSENIEKESNDRKNEEVINESIQTTINNNNQVKEFLRAVYNNEILKVQSILQSQVLENGIIGDQHGWNGLHWAASQGHTNILQLLLDQIPKHAVDLVEHINGWSPLHIAILQCQIPCIEMLLKAGANYKLQDKYGDTIMEFIESYRMEKKRTKVLELIQSTINSS